MTLEGSPRTLLTEVDDVASVKPMGDGALIDDFE